MTSGASTGSSSELSSAPQSELSVATGKSEEGRRSIALSPTLAEGLWQHRRRSAFQGDDELVFCHPERGTVYRPETFKETLTAALAAAGVISHHSEPLRTGVAAAAD
jgi:hypothetical protein